MDGLKTLNDFQQLLGHINWIWPYLRITTKDLEPLFSVLHGDSALDSPRELTPEGRKALELVQCKPQEAQVERCDPTQPCLSWCCLRVFLLHCCGRVGLWSGYICLCSPLKC